MQRVVFATPCPTRGLAVDGNDVGFVLAQALDPGGEAGAEEVGVERIDDVVERVVRRDAVAERQQAAQEGELLPAPQPDFDEVLGAGQRRAQHQQHDLRQRVEHLARLPWVVECREMVEQREGGHRGTSSR